MKKIKSRNSIISNLKLTTKTAILIVLALISSMVAVAAILKNIYNLQEKKHIEIQKTIITASEQLMEMTVESGVNIAKTIYTNENVYNFLNTEYSSSSEYYDAFYQLQNNNPMEIAETNIIDHYNVYTENPTILTGGNISSFNPVLDTDWYHEYKKLNKTMILYIDSVTNTVSIIRRLDFHKLKTGDCCLKLDLNMSLLTNYCDALDFNGEMYIINGGTLIYSNVPDITIENTGINPDFECYIKNYYTSDIEYYAYENRMSIMTFMRENIVFIAVFIAIIVIMIIAGNIFTTNIKKRLYHSANELRSEKKCMKHSGNGNDEIGKFIDVCINVAEKLAARNSDYRRTNEEIQQSNSRYNKLLETAMRLDAELYISEKYPYIKHVYSEYISLNEEIMNIRYVVKNITFSAQADLKVPVYSLMLIADDLSDNSLSVDIAGNEDTVTIIFTRSTISEQSKILRLQAIFEEGEFIDRYSFSHVSTYNPYIRLIQSFGNRISVEINNKNNFTLKITIE